MEVMVLVDKKTVLEFSAIDMACVCWLGIYVCD